MKPNMRTMFIPDEGYCFVEPDLAQADLRVVAWDADDTELMQLLMTPGLDIHTENAKIVFNTTQIDFQKRQDGKRSVHAADYLVGPKQLSKTLGILIHEADRFITRWLTAHPKIKAWHRRIDRQLQETRTIHNKFGFRIRYFDRVEQLLPEALAWIPQSTVAICVSKGILAVEAALPTVIPLLHCHDSPLLQIKVSELQSIKPQLLKCLTIPVPYEQPLIFPIELKVSSISWGHMKKEQW